MQYRSANLYTTIKQGGVSTARLDKMIDTKLDALSSAKIPGSPGGPGGPGGPAEHARTTTKRSGHTL